MPNLKRIAILLMIAVPSLASAAGITDADRHPPKSVTMPSAGGSYIDPVFGTRIIRVTDSHNGTHCIHAYSYWNAFNSDSTRLMINCDGTTRLYRWYPSSNTISSDGTLQGSDGYKVQFEGASWSRHVSSYVYAVDQKGTRLWRIDVSHRGKAGYSLVRDFASKIPSTTYISQLSMSDDAQSFTFHTRDRDTDNPREAYAWDRRTDTLYKFSRPSGYSLDETQINKDGSRVLVKWDDYDVTVWTFRTGAKKWLYHDDASDDVNGHYDFGRDFMVNSGNTHPGLVDRTFDQLGSADQILTYRDRYGRENWALCDHSSLRADPEEWVTASTYCGGGNYEPFEGEIFMVRLDGAGFVRLAHSRSTGNNVSSSWRYYSQPRAVIDKSGRYIVYTSDLNGSRHDVFILKVPSAYWPG